MSLILKKIIESPAAWKGRDFAEDSSWVHFLSEDDLQVIDHALTQCRRCHLEFPHFEKDDFSLHLLAKELGRFTEELENGRGFFLLRGLPIERYTEDDIKTIYYGIGLNLGQPVPQNPKGDLLGSVENVGDTQNKETRVYETNNYLPYHTDPSDVFGLLCLRKSMRGGLSSLVSSATVYNEILEHHPELLGLYYRPMYYAHLGEDSRSPVFSFYEGKLSCRYLRQYIEFGHEVRGLALSKVEVEALDLFDSITHDPSFRLDLMLEPGDLLFANNYAVLHSRTAYEDFKDPTQRRKLFRLWLKMPNGRKLAVDFPGRNGFSTSDIDNICAEN